MFIFILSLLLLSIILFSKESFWVYAVFVKGNVKYKIAGAKDFIDIKLGDILYEGDPVLLEENSKVSFLLSDGSLKVLEGKGTFIIKKEKEGTKPSLKIIAENFSKSITKKEGKNPMLKHLAGLRGVEIKIALMPNKTKVYPKSVVLRWLPVENVESFFVVLMDSEGSIYEATSDKNYLNIPDEKILPNKTYWWEVKDLKEKESINSLGIGSFSTLSSKEAEEVKKLETDLYKAKEDLRDNNKISILFLLYQIYRQYGMASDALFTIQKIVQEDKENLELLEIRKELCKELGISEKDLELF